MSILHGAALAVLILACLFGHQSYRLHGRLRRVEQLAEAARLLGELAHERLNLHGQASTEPPLTGLTPAQTAGDACVWCSATDTPMLAAGRTAAGRIVFCCRGRCAGHVQAFRLLERQGTVASLAEQRAQLDRAAHRRGRLRLVESGAAA